jgi:hypothetical protein
MPVQESVVKKVLSNDEYAKYETFIAEKKQIVERATDEEYVRIVHTHGWKICRRCKRGVEKMEGCNHLACLCSHEFCYSCGADWIPRRCACPLFPGAEEEEDDPVEGNGMIVSAVL